MNAYTLVAVIAALVLLAVIGDTLRHIRDALRERNLQSAKEHLHWLEFADAVIEDLTNPELSCRPK